MRHTVHALFSSFNKVWCNSLHLYKVYSQKRVYIIPNSEHNLLRVVLVFSLSAAVLLLFKDLTVENEFKRTV